MFTINQIRGMSLVDRQKLFVAMNLVQASDKDYTLAQKIIEQVSKTKGWGEPPTYEVTNSADHDVKVDGKTISKGSTGQVHVWQYLALSRFLDPGDELKKVLKDLYADEREKIAERDAADRKANPASDIGKIIADAIKEAMGLVKGKAALVLFAFTLALMSTTKAIAQVQPYVVGAPGQFNVLAIDGYLGTTNILGGTNYEIGTNATLAIPIITTNSITNANWGLSGPLGSTFPTNTSQITQAFTTNVPGMVSMANYDMADIYWQFNLVGAGTGAGVLIGDYSADGVFWQLGAINASLVANGTTPVSTNISLSAFAPGYIRFSTLSYPSLTIGQSNIVLELERKTSKTGP